MRILLNLLAFLTIGALSADESATSCNGAALKYAFGLSRISTEVYENQYDSNTTLSLNVPESWEAKVVSSEVLSNENGVRETKEVFLITNKNASDNITDSYTVSVLNQSKKPEGQDEKAFCSFISASSDK